MAVYGLGRISDPQGQPQSAVMAPKSTVWGERFVGMGKKPLSQNSPGKNGGKEGDL